MITLKPHPRFNTIAQYIEFAESKGVDWIINGGPNSPCEVKLAYSDQQDFFAETESDISPNVAFHDALMEGKLI